MAATHARPAPQTRIQPSLRNPRRRREAHRHSPLHQYPRHCRPDPHRTRPRPHHRPLPQRTGQQPVAHRIHGTQPSSQHSIPNTHRRCNSTGHHTSPSSGARRHHRPSPGSDARRHNHPRTRAAKTRSRPRSRPTSAPTTPSHHGPAMAANPIVYLSAATPMTNLRRQRQCPRPNGANPPAIHGMVVLEITISKTGTVDDVKIVSGPPCSRTRLSPPSKHRTPYYSTARAGSTMNWFETPAIRARTQMMAVDDFRAPLRRRA